MVLLLLVFFYFFLVFLVFLLSILSPVRSGSGKVSVTHVACHLSLVSCLLSVYFQPIAWHVSGKSSLPAEMVKHREVQDPVTWQCCHGYEMSISLFQWPPTNALTSTFSFSWLDHCHSSLIELTLIAEIDFFLSQF